MAIQLEQAPTFRALHDRVGVGPVSPAADGVADDRVAWQVAVDQAASGPKLLRGAGAEYYVGAIPPTEIKFNIGPQPSVLLKPGVREYDFAGATIKVPLSSRGIGFGRWYSIAHDPADYPIDVDYGGPDSPGNSYRLIADDIPAGSFVYPLETGGAADLGLTAGSTVLVMLGEYHYDKQEPAQWALAKVVSVSGDNVSLDTMVTDAFDLAQFDINHADGGAGSSAATGPNKRLKAIPILERARIANAVVEAPAGGALYGFNLYGARDVTFDNIGSVNACIYLQFCEGITLNDCWVEGGNSSLKGFALAETRNVVFNRLRGKGVRFLLGSEAGGHWTANDAMLENTYSNVNGQVVIFAAVGKGTGHVHNLTVTGYGGFTLDGNLNSDNTMNGQITYSGNMVLRLTSEPYNLPVARMNCVLDKTVNGVREVWDFTRPVRWKRRIWLKDGVIQSFDGPAGIVCGGSIHVSSGVGLGLGNDLQRVYFTRPSGVSPQDQVPNLQAGKSVPVYPSSGTIGGTNYTYRNEPLRVTINTQTSAGLEDGGEYLELDLLIAQRLVTGNAMPDNAYAYDDDDVLGLVDYNSLQPTRRQFLAGKLYTVANLPAASSALRGARLTVTDANATYAAGIGTTVAGGGSNVVPVFCDGSDWLIGG